MSVETTLAPQLAQTKSSEQLQSPVPGSAITEVGEGVNPATALNNHFHAERKNSRGDWVELDPGNPNGNRTLPPPTAPAIDAKLEARSPFTAPEVKDSPWEAPRANTLGKTAVEVERDDKVGRIRDKMEQTPSNPKTQAGILDRIQRKMDEKSAELGSPEERKANRLTKLLAKLR